MPPAPPEPGLLIRPTLPDMPPAPPPRDLGPAQPRPANARDPWSALGEALEKISPLAAKLGKGRARLDRGVLTISLPGGRMLADGRRALRNPAVVEAVHQYYSDTTTVEVVALPNTGSDRDRQDALERQALADPHVQRIMKALDAQLLRVVPLTDGE